MPVSTLQWVLSQCILKKKTNEQLLDCWSPETIVFKNLRGLDFPASPLQEPGMFNWERSERFTFPVVFRS